MQTITQEVRQINRLSPEPTVDEEKGTAIVYLYEDITEESSSRLIGEIEKLAGFSVQLKLKTYGGNLDDTLAIADVVKEQGIQVHVNGYANSGGFIILCAADIRTMSPNSTLMYHDITYGYMEKVAKHEIHMKELKRRRQLVHNIITSNTHISQETLEEHDRSTHEWYLGFEDAESLGVITHKLITKEVTEEPMEMEPETYMVKEYEEISVPEMKNMDDSEYNNTDEGTDDDTTDVM